MGYVYVKIFLGTPVHLGASDFVCLRIRKYGSLQSLGRDYVA